MTLFYNTFQPIYNIYETHTKCITNITCSIILQIKNTTGVEYITKNICRGNNNGDKSKAIINKGKIKKMNRAELLDIISKQQKEIDIYEIWIENNKTKQIMTDGNSEHRVSNCEPGGIIFSQNSKVIDETNISEHASNENGKDMYTQCYLYYDYIMHVIILLK